MPKLTRVPAVIAVAFIHLYQRTLARLMPARCRFVPTCSVYAVEAIETNGLIRGGAAATWRLMRCGPWTAGGFDPVHVHRGASRG